MRHSNNLYSLACNFSLFVITIYAIYQLDIIEYIDKMIMISLNLTRGLEFKL